MRNKATEAQLILDNRLSHRYQLNLSAKAIRFLNETDMTVINLSETGLSAKIDTSEIPVNRGDRLQIRLTDAIFGSATVIWVDGGVIGAKFEQRLSRAELATSRLISDPGSQKKTMMVQHVNLNENDYPRSVYDDTDDTLTKTVRMRILFATMVCAWAFTAILAFVIWSYFGS